MINLSLADVTKALIPVHEALAIPLEFDGTDFLRKAKLVVSTRHRRFKVRARFTWNTVGRPLKRSDRFVERDLSQISIALRS